MRSETVLRQMLSKSKNPEGPYKYATIMELSPQRASLLWFWDPDSIIGVHMDPLGNMDFKVGFWRSLLTVLGLWSRFLGFGTVLGSVCTD